MASLAHGSNPCSLQEERDKEAIVTRHVKGPDVWPGVAGPHKGMWPDATRSGMRRQGMRPDVARCGLMLDVVVVEFGRCIHGQCGPNRQWARAGLAAPRAAPSFLRRW